jgi:hypothetical protein
VTDVIAAVMGLILMGIFVYAVWKIGTNPK